MNSKTKAINYDKIRKLTTESAFNIESISKHQKEILENLACAWGVVKRKISVVASYKGYKKEKVVICVEHDT